MKLENLYAVVVLYNVSVNNSITCNNLLKIKGNNIITIVVDNSTVKNDNAALCAKKGFKYLSMHGNVGLSKAYNAVLDYLKNKNGVVIWFDDDTNITQEFFNVLNRAIINHPEVDIFAPIIMGQDRKFWSPNRARFFKNKQLKNINEKINNNEFNAINSCTASRLRIFSNYRYDERLFLDQVDHSFCRDQRNKHRKFLKLNCIIHHNFSTKSKMTNITKVKKRYSLMIPDFLTFSNTDKFHLMLGYIKVLGWGIREGKKYNNIFFLPWCIYQIKLWKNSSKGLY